MVTVTVTTLVVLVLGMVSGVFSNLAGMLLNFIGNLFDDSFYNVMAIETNFYDMTRSNMVANRFISKWGKWSKGSYSIF